MCCLYTLPNCLQHYLGGLQFNLHRLQIHPTPTSNLDTQFNDLICWVKLKPGIRDWTWVVSRVWTAILEFNHCPTRVLIKSKACFNRLHVLLELGPSTKKDCYNSALNLGCRMVHFVVWFLKNCSYLCCKSLRVALSLDGR